MPVYSLAVLQVRAQLGAAGIFPLQPAADVGVEGVLDIPALQILLRLLLDAGVQAACRGRGV